MERMERIHIVSMDRTAAQADRMLNIHMMFDNQVVVEAEVVKDKSLALMPEDKLVVRIEDTVVLAVRWVERSAEAACKGTALAGKDRWTSLRTS